MYASRTSSKGQVVIPKEIRDRLGIRAGGRVGFSLVADHVEIYPLPEEPVEAYHGIFRKGSSLTKALLRDRGEEREREDKKGS